MYPSCWSRLQTNLEFTARGSELVSGRIVSDNLGRRHGAPE